MLGPNNTVFILLQAPWRKVSCTNAPYSDALDLLYHPSSIYVLYIPQTSREREHWGEFSQSSFHGAVVWYRYKKGRGQRRLPVTSSRFVSHPMVSSGQVQRVYQFVGFIEYVLLQHGLNQNKRHTALIVRRDYGT
jgi:hypothetical protein